MKHAYRWPALLGLFVLTACGGGHSSGGGSGNTSPPQTYTIGGSISDLGAASGLQLQDNGGDTLTVTAGATSFQFATPLASGSSYAVTVSANPSGETCTVTANGSGPVTANVINVTISCTANTPPVTYTIGGTIEGLTASGLVLNLDSGGNTVDTYDATASTTAFPFAFTTALASGSSYAVTVSANPSGETCNVSDGGGTATANFSGVIVSCSQYAADLATNAVTVTVGNGPAGSSQQLANIPYVTVTVCEPDTTTCATIDNVEVDTGSSGLRLLASALANPDEGSAVSLMPLYDYSGNPLGECWSLGGDVAWGAIETADVKIGPETASGVKVQVIGDSSLPTVPTDCSGTPLSSVSDFDANGVLGVGVRAQDCGSSCGTNYVYYSCPTPSTCSSITSPATTDQVPNPVTVMTNKSGTPDNNGVILQLPAIPSGGLPTATGYLVFGIGTETSNNDDNDIGSATILDANPQGFISTSLIGGSSVNSYLDSGSNVLVFNSSVTQQCTGDFTGYYCPNPSPQPFTATNTGYTAGIADASFEVANAQNLSQSNFALNDIGAYTADTTLFDFGLPFFYGKTVFVGIQGASATPGGTTYQYGFFAY